ncbi:MAG: amino-acid N-acetyltransferase [Gammaproteobacteria bacterium]|nr:amino-acid N-acetyltransferase [Gammaproteobacteria bacterium]
MAVETQAFVDWFRGASPYINAHRGRTFVIQFGGEAVESEGFHHLIQDIALLNSLGIRIVLVHGIRPQIERRMKERRIEASFKDGLRITDDASLVVAREAAGYVRVSVEALLSMGLPNSPMAGACLRVTSGNFITARPVGIRDGVDFCHTGEVRRVDREGIERQLKEGTVVLISNLGYSPTGEAFNLSAEEVATAIAVELKAAKLLLIGEQPDLRHTDGKPLRQLTLAEARRKLAKVRAGGTQAISDTARHLQSAIYACTNGVKRAHLVDRSTDGVLLLELFTRDGVGTMVSADPYENVRQARIEDVGGILELIEPLEREGVLVRRPREKLEQEIHRFTVVERDGTIIACAALYPAEGEKAIELACLAVHPAYQSRGFGDLLLGRLERHALTLGADSLFALTTRATHWFLERGFQEQTIDGLPTDKQASYNYQRNSKVLLKRLVP